tara:strand:+ start:1860 stop:1967 length:108 start_codon:yes stop_codon:yes gene_type:complete
VRPELIRLVWQLFLALKTRVRPVDVKAGKAGELAG